MLIEMCTPKQFQIIPEQIKEQLKTEEVINIDMVFPQKSSSLFKKTLLVTINGRMILEKQKRCIMTAHDVLLLSHHKQTPYKATYFDSI